MYKYLLFDLDGTLMDFKKAERCALEAVLNHYHIKYNNELLELFSVINEECWQKFSQQIYKTRISFQEGRFAKFFKVLNVDYNVSEANAMYLDFISKAAYLMPNCLTILQYLSTKYQLYVATNGVKKVQINRLANGGILKFFHAVFVSEEIGFQKPERAFFTYVKEYIGDDDGANYLMIGDREDADVIGSKDSGMKACLYSHGPSSTADYLITDLNELKKFL